VKTSKCLPIAGCHSTAPHGLIFFQLANDRWKRRRLIPVSWSKEWSKSSRYSHQCNRTNLPATRIQTSPQDEKFKELLEIVDRVGDKGLREISIESGIESRKVKQLLEEAEKKGFVKIERVKTKGRPKPQ